MSYETNEPAEGLEPEALWQPWLRAERAEQEDAAEAALFELFAALPAPALSASFVDDVLLQAGVVAPISRDLQGWSRWATAGALVIVALATAWLLPIFLGLILLSGPAGILAPLADAVPFAARLVVEGLSLVRTLGAVLGAAWQVATTPHVLSLLTALAAAVFVAGHRLSLLIGIRRSLIHAPSA